MNSKTALLLCVCVALLATAAYANPFDKISEGIKSATGKVTGAVDKTVNGTKGAVNTVTNGTKTAVNSVENAGKTAVGGAKNVTDAIGNALNPRRSSARSAAASVAAAGFGALMLVAVAL